MGVVSSATQKRATNPRLIWRQTWNGGWKVAHSCTAGFDDDAGVALVAAQSNFGWRRRGLFVFGRDRSLAGCAAATELYRNFRCLRKASQFCPSKIYSNNKDNSDFAAGIQDDVLTSLAQIHGLKVISRTSAMAYEKTAGRNIREIAQALGVANVLEGSVRRTGDRVLVNVQLIDARDDRHVWAERYDRTVADAIGLQGELATQIAAALKTTLAPAEMARFAVKPTANSEAYVLYLTALGKEATDWDAAEELYVEATAVDPAFALAYARASLMNTWISSYGQFPARNKKARAQAEEALRLDSNLGEAHLALGLCLYWGEKNYRGRS